MKRLVGKPRRGRKSVILTMKFVMDIHEDNKDEAKDIGKKYIAWMRDKFSNWNESILEYFLYENNIAQNTEDDRLELELHLDKIIKDDCTHSEDREIEEYNLNDDNKDTSSSESTVEREFKEN